jgi:energy-converting hydrogenase Eha subunit H
MPINVYIIVRVRLRIEVKCGTLLQRHQISLYYGMQLKTMVAIVETLYSSIFFFYSFFFSLMDMSNIGFESEFEDLVDVCLFKFLW